ncbi:MAG: hypothetical protein KC468_07285, partial [Myxococcales bacterium]|nr:hypothetical protein [Myxococcales bacterium]
MQTPRAPVAGATLIAGALLMGCTSPPLKSVQEGGWVCSVRGARCDVGISLAVARQVDVLFVVDSSATMAEEQRKLAAAIPALTRALDRKRAELRVGVTTADMGNPRCAGDEYRDPDRGRLVQASCRDRLGPDGDFVFDSLGVAAEFACTDYCDAGVHAALQGGLTPTEIYDDDSVAPRPWYEHGVLSNLPAGVVEATAALPENNDADPNNDVSPLAAALRCGLPQGVNGCGFESPLESMFWALRRAQEPTEASFGFLRDAALLGVALVTDELDCSFNPAQELIFVDLNSTWAWEPGAVTPTSAVCWNAGVVCAGEAPGPYVGCTAADYDIDGALILDGSQDERAVLYPLARYIDELDAIENYKKMIDQNQEVFVSLLAGVPEGYAEGAAELEYRDDDDAEAHALYGIGPGCDG